MEEFQGAEQVPVVVAQPPAPAPPPATTCTFMDDDGLTRTYNIPLGGFQLATFYSSIEDAVGICKNVGYWCGGQWTQSIYNPGIGAGLLTSTTCVLP